MQKLGDYKLSNNWNRLDAIGVSSPDGVSLCWVMPLFACYGTQSLTLYGSYFKCIQHPEDMESAEDLLQGIAGMLAKGEPNFDQAYVTQEEIKRANSAIIIIRNKLTYSTIDEDKSGLQVVQGLHRDINLDKKVLIHHIGHESLRISTDLITDIMIACCVPILRYNNSGGYTSKRPEDYRLVYRAKGKISQLFIHLNNKDYDHWVMILPNQSLFSGLNLVTQIRIKLTQAENYQTNIYGQEKDVPITHMQPSHPGMIFFINHYYKRSKVNAVKQVITYSPSYQTRKGAHPRPYLNEGIPVSWCRNYAASTFGLHSSQREALEELMQEPSEMKKMITADSKKLYPDYDAKDNYGRWTVVNVVSNKESDNIDKKYRFDEEAYNKKVQEKHLEQQSFKLSTYFKIDGQDRHYSSDSYRQHWASLYFPMPIPFNVWRGSSYEQFKSFKLEYRYGNEFLAMVLPNLIELYDMPTSVKEDFEDLAKLGVQKVKDKKGDEWHVSRSFKGQKGHPGMSTCMDAITVLMLWRMAESMADVADACWEDIGGRTPKMINLVPTMGKFPCISYRPKDSDLDNTYLKHCLQIGRQSGATTIHKTTLNPDARDDDQSLLTSFSNTYYYGTELQRKNGPILPKGYSTIPGGQAHIVHVLQEVNGYDDKPTTFPLFYQIQTNEEEKIGDKGANEHSDGHTIKKLLYDKLFPSDSCVEKKQQLALVPHKGNEKTISQKLDVCQLFDGEQDVITQTNLPKPCYIRSMKDKNNPNLIGNIQGKYLVSVDSIYYPGVQNYIHARLYEGNVTKVGFSMNVFNSTSYHPTSGNFYDNEGSFRVSYNKILNAHFVTMTTRGSQTEYAHEIPSGISVASRSAFTWKGLYFKVYWSVRTGKSSAVYGGEITLKQGGFLAAPLTPQNMRSQIEIEESTYEYVIQNQQRLSTKMEKQSLASDIVRFIQYRNKQESIFPDYSNAELLSMVNGLVPNALLVLEQQYLEQEIRWYKLKMQEIFKLYYEPKADPKINHWREMKFLLYKANNIAQDYWDWDADGFVGRYYIRAQKINNFFIHVFVTMAIWLLHFVKIYIPFRRPVADWETKIQCDELQARHLKYPGITEDRKWIYTSTARTLEGLTSGQKKLMKQRYAKVADGSRRAKNCFTKWVASRVHIWMSNLGYYIYEVNQLPIGFEEMETLEEKSTQARKEDQELRLAYKQKRLDSQWQERAYNDYKPNPALKAPLIQRERKIDEKGVYVELSGNTPPPSPDKTGEPLLNDDTGGPEDEDKPPSKPVDPQKRDLILQAAEERREAHQNRGIAKPKNTKEEIRGLGQIILDNALQYFDITEEAKQKMNRRNSFDDLTSLQLKNDTGVQEALWQSFKKPIIPGRKSILRNRRIDCYDAESESFLPLSGKRTRFNLDNIEKKVKFVCEGGSGYNYHSVYIPPEDIFGDDEECLECAKLNLNQQTQKCGKCEVQVYREEQTTYHYSLGYFEGDKWNFLNSKNGRLSLRRIKIYKRDKKTTPHPFSFKKKQWKKFLTKLDQDFDDPSVLEYLKNPIDPDITYDYNKCSLRKTKDTKIGRTWDYYGEKIFVGGEINTELNDEEDGGKREVVPTCIGEEGKECGLCIERQLFRLYYLNVLYFKNNATELGLPVIGKYNKHDGLIAAVHHVRDLPFWKIWEAQLHHREAASILIGEFQTKALTANASLGEARRVDLGPGGLQLQYKHDCDYIPNPLRVKTIDDILKKIMGVAEQFQQEWFKRNRKNLIRKKRIKMRKDSPTTDYSDTNQLLCIPKTKEGMQKVQQITHLVEYYNKEQKMREIPSFQTDTEENKDDQDDEPNMYLFRKDESPILVKKPKQEQNYAGAHSNTQNTVFTPKYDYQKPLIGGYGESIGLPGKQGALIERYKKQIQQNDDNDEQENKPVKFQKTIFTPENPAIIKDIEESQPQLLASTVCRKEGNRCLLQKELDKKHIYTLSDKEQDDIYFTKQDKHQTSIHAGDPKSLPTGGVRVAHHLTKTKSPLEEPLLDKNEKSNYPSTHVLIEIPKSNEYGEKYVQPKDFYEEDKLARAQIKKQKDKKQLEKAKCSINPNLSDNQSGFMPSRAKSFKLKDFSQPYSKKKRVTSINSNAQFTCYTRDGVKLSMGKFEQYLKESQSEQKKMQRRVYNIGMDVEKFSVLKPKYANLDDQTQYQAFKSRMLGFKAKMADLGQRLLRKVQNGMIEKHSNGIKSQMANGSVKCLTIHEWIDKFEPKKRELYTVALKEFLETGKIDLKVEAFQKSLEAQFCKDDDVRGRLIWNPSSGVKAIVGYLNYLLIQYTHDIEPGFVQGLNAGELCDKIHDKYRTIKDPVIISWDGSQHDSAMSNRWLRLFREIIKSVGVELLHNHAGDIFSYGDCITICEAAVQVKFKFVMYYTEMEYGKRIPMIEGTISGVVLSGFGPMTTYSNSLCILSLAYAAQINQHVDIQQISVPTKFDCSLGGRDVTITDYEEKEKVVVTYSQIPGTKFCQDTDQCYSLVSGDDGNVEITARSSGPFLQNISALTQVNNSDQINGLGYILKEVIASNNKMSFLSKDIFVDEYRILLSRQIDRILQGGNVTGSDVGRTNPELINYTVTRQLEAGHTYHPVVQEYIKYRYANLEHHSIDMEQIKLLDRERWYKIRAQENHFDTPEGWDGLELFDQNCESNHLEMTPEGIEACIQQYKPGRTIPLENLMCQQTSACCPNGA